MNETPNMRNPKWILGLTGGICCGKSTASQIFTELACSVIDADLSAREVVAPGTIGLEGIVKHFGAQILQADGTLNRRKLRTIIFASPEEKSFLDNLLHPLIIQDILNKLRSAQGCYVVLVAPLMFETGLEKFTDYVLCMDTDEETQIERIQLRDGSSRETAEAIVKSQLPRSYRISHSDTVIESDFPAPEDMAAKIRSLHQDFLKLAAKKESAKNAKNS